jgi:preprotein translocase subunit SecD
VGQKLLISLAIVIVVAIGSALLAVPPKEKIHLGLDLRGGLYLVLEVQTDNAVERMLQRTAELVREELRARGLPILSVEPTAGRGIRLVFSQPPDGGPVQEVTRHYISASVSRQSPESLVVDIPETELRQVRTNTVDQALEKIRNRIDAFKVKHALPGGSPQRRRMIWPLSCVKERCLLQCGSLRSAPSVRHWGTIQSSKGCVPPSWAVPSSSSSCWYIIVYQVSSPIWPWD